VAQVFDATRIGTGRAAMKFVKENASVGMYFVKDRLARLRAGDVYDLAPGTGGIVRVEGNTIGAYRDESGKIHAVSVTCARAARAVGFLRPVEGPGRAEDRQLWLVVPALAYSTTFSAPSKFSSFRTDLSWTAGYVAGKVGLLRDFERDHVIVGLEASVVSAPD